MAALATSDDGVEWTKRGPVLDLGSGGALDSTSASYGTTYFDGKRWHMICLGTSNAMSGELKTPAFAHATLRATAASPTGPWRKQPDVIPFPARPGTWCFETPSPGQVIRHGDEFLQIFSASTADDDDIALRTLGLARTKDLDGSWAADTEPLLPLTEQIENSSIYFEPSTGMWFLFTDHVTSADDVTPMRGQDGTEYPDAVWVYWSDDPTRFSEHEKAVVIDTSNSRSPRLSDCRASCRSMADWRSITTARSSTPSATAVAMSASNGSTFLFRSASCPASTIAYPQAVGEKVLDSLVIVGLETGSRVDTVTAKPRGCPQMSEGRVSYGESRWQCAAPAR